MPKKKEKITALYERLSHDDERQDGDEEEQQSESNSITNQKLMLQNYAREHRFTRCISPLPAQKMNGTISYAQTAARRSAVRTISVPLCWRNWWRSI